MLSDCSHPVKTLSNDDQQALPALRVHHFGLKLWRLESPGEVIRAVIAELAASFATVMNAIVTETR
jgi:hypothetical protein